MSDLAIIIPAYKETFLEEAIQSISSQTCKDFTLYVGDDCSPYPLKNIVDNYTGKIKIIYHRFETNIGGKDLVAQWERCIALSKNEKWIWLFSDDDVMEPNCVASFYKAIKETSSYYDVYHFNVNIIDEHSKVKKVPPSYPQVLDSYQFYKKKMLGKIISLVVENVFSRNIYEKTGGFQNFDLAWGSDTATWIKFSSDKGMYTIPKSKILWRESSQNISPNHSTPIVIRKTNALLDFFQWSFNYFQNKSINCYWVSYHAFIIRCRHFKKYISQYQLNTLIKQFGKIHYKSYLNFITKLLIKL